MTETTSKPDDRRDLLIDAHVHLHPEHDLGSVYGHAARRFARAGAGSVGVLMLTHSTRARAIAADLADGPAGWVFEELEPGRSGVVRHDQLGELTLITGHQIVTKERIEALALAAAVSPADGLPLEDTLVAVRDHGGFPVLPWGFGKWWGGRGRHLERVLGACNQGDLALGDNAGRPIGWRSPRLFSLAEKRGIPVLPGTDPLAIPGHMRRPGSFGFRLQANFDPARPADSILTHLRSLRSSPQAFGHRTNPVSFVLDQVSIRVRKATKAGGAA